MKLLDDFRDAALVRRLVDEIEQRCTRPWTIMEVCGGQTHAIVRYGLDHLLPEGVSLIHGPGCPVCVTPIDAIDAAISLAERGVVIASYGDMVRVPGTVRDLLGARSNGGDVRIVYSPLDAVEMAAAESEKAFVFFAVGFETTAPANAMAVLEAQRRGLSNFSMLVSHVLVPPAIRTILDSGVSRIDAFLAAGHVCTVMGLREYRELAVNHGVPIVVTGFEPVDILRGVARAIEMLEDGRVACENAYERVVREDGNPTAREVVEEVFEVSDRVWRGIGTIPGSGLALRETWRDYDAAARYGLDARPEPVSGCIAGRVLTGEVRPTECPHFGEGCTPESPMGAPMVSGEGACSAYLKYRGLS